MKEPKVNLLPKNLYLRYRQSKELKGPIWLVSGAYILKQYPYSRKVMLLTLILTEHHKGKVRVF